MFKFFQVLSLLPIIGWPFVFYSTIFFFDNPNSNAFINWTAFLIVNSYPLILIGNSKLAGRIYINHRTLAYLFILWPIVLCSFLVVDFFSS
jgi:hypothetical protein